MKKRLKKTGIIILFGNIMPVAKRNLKPRFMIEEWNLRSSADQSTQKLAREFSNQPRHSMNAFINIARSHGFTASEALKMWKKMNP